ncbi:MAG: TRAP transporter small permease subunit [Deltaproteobacteria bacterium]
MGGLLAVSRGIDRVTEFIGTHVKWLILISILISATNAVIRKAFDMSSNGWLEAQWYLFGAAFLFASAHTLRQNEHIRIDIIYGMFARKTQHWIDLFGHVFFLMPFVLLMTWLLVPYTLQAWANQEVSTNAGGLIIWPARLFLLIGFALLIAQGLSEIIKKIAIMNGIIDDPAPFVAHHDAALKEIEITAMDVHK